MGETTREESGNKSAIDFVLVNRTMYNNFKSMMIDEDKTMYDLSDHCLIQVQLEMEGRKGKHMKATEVINYYCVKDEMEEAFIAYFEEMIENEDEDISIETWESMIKISADNILKRKFIRKSDIISGETEHVWLTKEMKENIKRRQYYNRLARNATCEEDRTLYKTMYAEQKECTRNMIRIGINDYEIKITNEIKSNKNAKNLFKNIDKLRGKKEKMMR